jgi:hypothetical protein
MKTLLLISALALSSAAVAQDAAPAMPEPIPTTSDTTGAPAGATPTQPGGPAASNTPDAPAQAPTEMTAGQASKGAQIPKEYPTCSRTITDNCNNRSGR